MALTDRRPQALVLRALGLGDLLTVVPALRGVRAALPSHRIVLAAPAPLAPLVELIDAVDELLPLSSLDDRLVTEDRPDFAVNLHGRGPRSHQLLSSLRPMSLVAYACSEVLYDGLAWTETEHEVQRWCRLISTCLGGECDPDKLDLRLPPPTRWPGAVVVHPGAASASRRWPVERFAQLCESLDYLGLHVVVTGSADEKALTAAVVAAAGLSPSVDLGGRLDLQQLAALVARARLIVSGDTGMAHLAFAFRRPSVTLYGPISPALWGPPQQRPQHRALWCGDRKGDPHGQRLDPALHAVSVGAVLDATVELLSHLH